MKEDVKDRLKKCLEELNKLNKELDESDVEEPTVEEHPLITALACNALSFQILKYQEIGAGCIFSDDKDTNITALFIDKDKKIDITVKGNKVFPHEFELVGKGETIEEQIDSILQQENALCLMLFKEAAAMEHSIVAYEDFYGKKLLEDLMARVEDHRFLVDKFTIHRDMLGRFKSDINAIDFDVASSKDLKELGIFASIWGVNIFVQSFNDCKDIIFATTEEKYLGGRTIRYIDTKDNTLTLTGSMYIKNPKCISAGAQSNLLNIKFK